MGHYRLFAVSLLAVAALAGLGAVIGAPGTSVRELDRVPVTTGE